MMPMAKASTYVCTYERARVRRLAAVRPPVRAYVRTSVRSAVRGVSRAYVCTLGVVSPPVRTRLWVPKRSFSV